MGHHSGGLTERKVYFTTLLRKEARRVLLDCRYAAEGRCPSNPAASGPYGRVAFDGRQGGRRFTGGGTGRGIRRPSPSSAARPPATGAVRLKHLHLDPQPHGLRLQSVALRRSRPQGRKLGGCAGKLLSEGDDVGFKGFDSFLLFEPSIEGFEGRDFEGGAAGSSHTQIRPSLSRSPLSFPAFQRERTLLGAMRSIAPASAKDIRTSGISNSSIEGVFEP